MDTASGYITGWVISVLPNSDTIAEAFCRACVPTVGDIAKGLPRSILITSKQNCKIADSTKDNNYKRQTVLTLKTTNDIMDT